VTIGALLQECDSAQNRVALPNPQACAWDGACAWGWMKLLKRGRYVRIAKTLTAAAALALAGGSIAAQAEPVRTAAPASEESELAGLSYGTQFLALALIAGVIAGAYALADSGDDDAVSN
tara:strand:+ start:1967 stop:2326 length:360 start_codon:yes stop_codon:yes gene_type:complete